MVALFLIARRLPARGSAPRPVPVPRPLRFASTGFCATLVFFVVQWVPPEIGLPVPLTLLTTVALIALVVWRVQRMSHGGAWTDEHRLALAGGALMFFVLLAPVAELDATRADNTAGMTQVGLALRASGHGMRTYVGQFMKGQPYGELEALRDHSCITIERYGDVRCIRREEGVSLNKKVG